MPNFEPALLEQIKSLVPISKLVGEYVTADAGKSSAGDLWACCVFHSEKTPSFHAEDAKGIYHCFGCGATGDHFQWMQEHQGMSFTQAVEAVADRAGVTLPGKRSEPSSAKPRAKYEAPKIADPYESYEFVPVPAGTPPIVPGQRTPELRNPKKFGTEKFTTHYKPSAVHAYENAAGELLGYVLLVEFKDGKSTPGIWWARGPDGFEGWCHGSIDNCPLYGLPELLAHPDKQVLVVEGEKCRRAADKALQGRVVVVSWCGGTNRVDRSDWLPLAGRRVIWWADNDDEGRKAMDQARSLSHAAKNKRVTPYGDKGGDVADLILAGGSVADYIKANISEWPIKAEKENEDDKATNGNSDMPVGVQQPNGRGNQQETDRADIPARTSSASPQREPLNATHRSPHPLPSLEPGAAPKDHIPPTQSVGGRGREAVTAIQEVDWESQLQYTKSGEGLDKSSLVNAALMLEYHDTLKGIYAWNDFSKEIAIMRKPPWERSWSGTRLIKETDITSTAMQMEFLGIKPKRSDMAAIIAQVAEYNRFNPVVDALERLEWDGVPRLMGGKHGKQIFAPLSVRYFGTENTEINAQFFCKTMVAAVARAYQPGCKVDTALILEGGQGAGKSTAIEVLAEAIAHKVYTDEIADPGSKDAGLQIQGRWIVEVSELDAFRRSETSTIKSWISRKEDKFRRPYGKVIENFPRSCVFIGSVNPPPHGYLKDPTGARRFWPVRVGEIDIPLLKEDALQLWAEARHMYLAGKEWFLMGDEVKQAEVVQAARLEGDPWNPLIAGFVDSHQMAMKTKINVSEIMGVGCLNIPSERRTVTQTGRIEAYLSGPLRWIRVSDGIYQRPV